MEDLYKVGEHEKVQEAEGLLRKDLQELKAEIEENEMVHGIPYKTSSVIQLDGRNEFSDNHLDYRLMLYFPHITSSVVLPKDPEYFRRLRKLVIHRGLDVCKANPLIIQAEAMKSELHNADKLEYTVDSLPLLLHQYFTDRIRQLVQSKHMHMLRWKRFCEHSSTIEALYPAYQKKLVHIMAEYNDCVGRAKRLSVVHESLLADNFSAALQAIKVDDILIYLRWLVGHLHSVKKINQFLRIIQWLPVSHKTVITPGPKEGKEEEDVSAREPKIPSRYQEDNYMPFSSKRSFRANTTTIPEATVVFPIPTAPPAINPTLLTSNPLPTISFAYAAAAAGGGRASDEENLGLPLHINDVEKLKPLLNYLVHIYAISYDVSTINSTADEMELYAAVNRKFKNFFMRQETMKTFKTYDRIEIGHESWGADHSTHAIKQMCNWVPFIQLQAESDPHQEKILTDLRMKAKVDVLLKAQAQFIKIQDADRVLDALRQHAYAVRDPGEINSASVTSNKTKNHTSAIWRKIYTNPELFASRKSSEDVAMLDLDDKEADNVNFSAAGRQRTTSARKRRDSYDYMNTVQMLGLDEGDQDNNSPASIQGGYMSFLYLRHLRIRDLQRTTLSILNYFRSIERTITINDGGLSLEAGNLKRQSHQNHRRGMSSDGGVTGGGGLSSHAYIHNTPADFKIDEAAFMEFSEVENHDDFYTVEEGRIHVQDQRGYYIMYESAIEDLKHLEDDLLLMATHFIEKDKEMRCAVGIKRSAAKRNQVRTAGDFEIPEYAHQEIDRFAILLDLWSNHTAFLENKLHLLNCYVEAYHHILDRDEKRNMAQTITNILHRAPRVDYADTYFVKSYRLECVILRLEATLIKNVLDKQIEDQREYIQRVCRADVEDLFGMPEKIIPKLPISVNISRPALRNIYMLEFHPSLALAGRFPDALRHSYWELHFTHKPETTMECLKLERKLLETATQEWNSMEKLGASYTMQTQRDLFADNYAEDPTFMCTVANNLIVKCEQESGKKTAKLRQQGVIEVVANLLEVLTLRHRLIESAHETEILSKIYRKLATEMGFEEYHLFMRFVQFEFAVHKPDAGKPPPIFITSILEDDPGVDRFVPKDLCLAIHELDEGHVGRFTFKNEDGLMQLLKGKGVHSLQAILMTQIVHTNGLIAAVLQGNVCQSLKEPGNDTAKSGRISPSETKSERSTLTATTGYSSTTRATEQMNRAKYLKNRRSPEAFVSIQLEKIPSRDVMLNEYVEKKTAMGLILKNPEEMEKLKRSLIVGFCLSFNTRVAQYSMRAQIIAYYNSLLNLLEDFPNIRDTYFMMGEPTEKKVETDDFPDAVASDPRKLRKRARRMMSNEGQHVLNIWFIPHHSEVLVMFKQLDDEQCHKALTYYLQIVGSLHDIVQYLCAHSRLGSSTARLGSRKMEFVSADWGGTEGIGSELREIQRQVNHLSSPHSPEMVAQFLQLRREIMFLEFDTSVRFSMRDTFLSRGNLHAYQAIARNMHFALAELSDISKPSFSAAYLTIPEPLEARDYKARELYPWRSYIGRSGLFPKMFPQWQLTEHYLQLCLAGLREVDRHVAHGEILGVSLLMEDVLNSGALNAEELLAEEDEVEEEGGEAEESRPASQADQASTGSLSRPQSSAKVSAPPSRKETGESLDTLSKVKSVVAKPNKKPLSRTSEPIQAYRLLKTFLTLWKQLEAFKMEWGCRRLGVERIDTVQLQRDFCKLYKSDMLYPVLASVARRYNQADLYEGMVSDAEPLVIPKGASEYEIRSKQLVKLLENLEIYMIAEVQKRINKEMNLVISERAREEGTLPTDLWKKPAMKETFTISKPYIAEKYAEELYSGTTMDEESNTVTFTVEHLDKCMKSLASSVMAREKQNFENYSMYYEGLLRHHHQLLYQKEQEVKHMQGQLQQANDNSMIDVQCQMAEQCHDLLMEVTALRAKVHEMRTNALTAERDIRERVREEYDDLVQNLFSAAFTLKAKLDEYKEDLHDSVYEMIGKTRAEAMEKHAEIKRKVGFIGDELYAENLANKAEAMRRLQQENHQLNKLLIKMKTMSRWKQCAVRTGFEKTISELTHEGERSRKEVLEIKMLAEEEVILNRQQIVAVRKALGMSEGEVTEIRKDLEKEMKLKTEKEHAAMQKARSQRQLDMAKMQNVEKLFEELELKEMQMQTLMTEQERHQRLQQLVQDKAKKDVTQIKKQLNHERHLKLDAFNRVDDLQTQVYDMEVGMYTNRPHSVYPMVVSSPPPVTVQRSKSGKRQLKPLNSGGSVVRSKTRLSQISKRSTTPSNPATSKSTGQWPPPVSWPANSGVPPDAMTNGDYKRIQRPRTVNTLGRLRSKMAEQLLNELDTPDHHETLIRLQEAQLKT